MAADLKLTLHGYYRSSASFRVRIALNLKGLPYGSITHHLRRGEQRDPNYLSLNPQGLVPTLLANAEAISQSLAIIEYLDEIVPTPALLPADAPGRARVRGLAQIIACDIHPVNNLRVLQYLRDPLKQPEEAVQRWYQHWVAEGLQAVEQLLATQPIVGRFCHGDLPGLADICLIPQVVNARNFECDLTSFPTITRIFNAAMQLEAFERASPKYQPDAE
jgi:maleylacetoacetate isomerase